MIFIDAIHVKIRDGKVANRPIYVALAVTAEGHRDILGLWAGDPSAGGEGAKYWLHVLTEIRNRGVNDVLMVVCDGLSGLSWNCGEEGETADTAIDALRERQKRNILTTLMLSQGVPMLAHGDELGRTQQGNNNVYCQDNELSWVDWENARQHEVLTTFTGRLARLRAEHPIFRRQRFFQGHPVRGTNLEDIAWLRPDGQPMSDQDWNSDHTQTLTIYLNGEGIPDRDELGMQIIDDSFLLLFNAHHEDQTITLPDENYGKGWHIALNTADPLLADDRNRFPAPGGLIEVTSRSILILQRSF